MRSEIGWDFACFWFLFDCCFKTVTLWPLQHTYTALSTPNKTKPTDLLLTPARLSYGGPIATAALIRPSNNMPALTRLLQHSMAASAGQRWVHAATRCSLRAAGGGTPHHRTSLLSSVLPLPQLQRGRIQCANSSSEREQQQQPCIGSSSKRWLADVRCSAASSEDAASSGGKGTVRYYLRWW